jgi:hypothetical protein
VRHLLLRANALGTLGVHEKGDNETVKTYGWLTRAQDRCAAELTQDFSENENQNHSDEQPGLLSGSSYTSVTDNTDGETSSHTRQTDRETGTELDEAGEERNRLRQTVGDQDRDDKTVDTNDTSHDDGDNVCAVLAIHTLMTPSSIAQNSSQRVRRTLDDQVRAEDTHGTDSHTGLRGAVSGSEASEDDG